MKLKIEIDVDASETIVDTIKRGSFTVDRDGSGIKIQAGDIIVPRRKCKIQFSDTSLQPKKKKKV